jgi:hypothetical protein
MTDSSGLDGLGGTGDDSLDLEVAAASILNANRDVQSLLKALAAQLSSALGDRMRVERKGSLLHRSDEVKSLEADIGKEQFRAEAQRGGIACTVAHASGGIRIRSDEVTMDQWLRRLLEALQAEAAHSDAVRAALEHIVIGGPS